MKLLTRLFSHLILLLRPSWTVPVAASWYRPQPLHTGRPGHSGVPAARRAARKARNRRRHHGRA